MRFFISVLACLLFISISAVASQYDETYGLNSKQVDLQKGELPPAPNGFLNFSKSKPEAKPSAKAYSEAKMKASSPFHKKLYGESGRPDLKKFSEKKQQKTSIEKLIRPPNFSKSKKDPRSQPLPKASVPAFATEITDWEGVSYTGYMDDYETDDWYRVYVNKFRRHVSVDLEFSDPCPSFYDEDDPPCYPGDYDLDLEFYDYNGNLLDYSYSYADDYLSHTVPQPGYYYIRIDAPPTSYRDLDMYYDVTWYSDLTYTPGDDDFEITPNGENDSRATAYDFTSYAGLWARSVAGDALADDDDYYKVSVTSPFERLVVDVRFDDSDGDIDLAVYNSAGNLVAASNSINDDEYVDVLLPSGTYYVKIFPYANQDAGNTYDFKYYNLRLGNILAEDSYEQNDTRATSNPSITKNTVIYGAQYDRDWFKFTPQSGVTDVQVRLLFQDTVGDMEISVFKDSGDETGYSYGYFNGETAYLSVTAGRSYYIRVSGSNRGNAYSLRWDESFNGPQPEDRYEPNDAFSRATDLSGRSGTWLSQYQGWAVQADDDTYKFNVSDVTKPIVITADFKNSEGNIDLEFYNSSQTLIGFSRTTQDQEIIQKFVTSPGTYYVRAKGANRGNYYDLKWESSNSAFNLSQGYTGSWYDPAMSGQGFNLEYVDADSDQFIAYWYTYDLSAPAAGGLHRPLWIIGQGSVQGKTANLRLYATLNGQFNAPGSQLIDVGSASVEAIDCSTVRFSYSLDYPGATSRTGTMTLSRLSPNLVINSRNICSNQSVAQTMTPTTGIQKGHTGSWYNQPTAGQGFGFEYNDQSSGPTATLYWYTYEATGTATNNKSWFIAQGPITPGSDNTSMTLYRTPGGVFLGSSTFQLIDSGTVNVKFLNCTEGVITVQPNANSSLPQATLQIPISRLTPQMSYQGQALCR